MSRFKAHIIALALVASLPVGFLAGWFGVGAIIRTFPDCGPKVLIGLLLLILLPRYLSVYKRLRIKP